MTNLCAEHPFCLNFSGERVEVRAQEATAPPPVVVPKKKKPKPARPPGPDLFEAVP